MSRRRGKKVKEAKSPLQATERASAFSLNKMEGRQKVLSRGMPSVTGRFNGLTLVAEPWADSGQ